MAFRRSISNQLLRWKSSDNRKPLIVRGARQVGKTTLIRDFAKTYSHVIHLNLEKPGDRRFFEDIEDVYTIVESLLLTHGIPSSGMDNTLLFIDEIQESPKAIQLLRYFYEELPQLHVISAGSLLEFALHSVQSFPVGRVEFLYLHPLNFQEYLEAIGKPGLLEVLREVPVRPAAHGPLLEAFHRYAIIGGMPEVVKVDNANHQLSDLVAVYESIWGTYKNDVEKYTSNDSERKIIKHLMDTAPLYLDERVKFQGFGNSNYRSREVGEAFRTLDAARIIRLLYPTTDLAPPLKADLKKSPRLQLLDTGIINYTLGIQAEMLAMTELSTAYRGAIIPHLITQELTSLQQQTDGKPFFWVREKAQSSAEVDLVYVYQKWAIPIEIKSGATGRLRSLHQFVDVADHPFAIRIYGGVFQLEHTVTPNKKPYILLNLPYYTVTMLPQYVSWLVNQV
ncbi:ATP-binding protein [Parapedobacter sp. ISTM3]|uniref:ATP-binding protein n=1 Tax=Parapedobacter sp. ISTM3 TaxID=2800130 RepID=UPI001908C8DF|nr:AAA family ATPase [Parapedobacter sp. ISTM3]MBK1441881.1 ATP-binding protein [Parapedobacter sp. ISTM3]